jgi:type I restriction enzyme S subunit
MSIDLEPHLLQRVRSILRQHVPDCEVWAFGSRVGSSSKSFSDLDLAVIAAKELPTRQLALLAHAFEHSDLPIKIDVLDWNAASQAMRDHISARHEIVFRPASG